MTQQQLIERLAERTQTIKAEVLKTKISKLGNF